MAKCYLIVALLADPNAAAPPLTTAFSSRFGAESGLDGTKLRLRFPETLHDFHRPESTSGFVADDAHALAGTEPGSPKPEFLFKVRPSSTNNQTFGNFSVT